MTKNLKSILIGISEREEKAGGAVSGEARSALRLHRRRKLVMAVALAIFVLSCLALSAYLLIEKSSQAGRGFAGLAGIGGTGGALEALRRIWKDYSQTDLLLILIQDASEAQVTALINKLIKTL